MNEPIYGFDEASAKLFGEMANKHRQRLPDVGRRTRRVAMQTTSSVTIDGVPTCGSCIQIDGSYEIEIVPGLFAPEEFLVTLICADDPITLTYDGMVGDDHVWTSGSVSVSCTGGSETITVTLTVSGYLPGEMLISTSGSGGVGTWENEVAWQNKLNTNFRLKTVDNTCPCAPFEPHPCLTPSPGV